MAPDADLLTLIVVGFGGETIASVQVYASDPVEKLKNQAVSAHPKQYVIAMSEGTFMEGSLIPLGSSVVQLGDKGLWQAEDGTVHFVRQPTLRSAKILFDNVELADDLSVGDCGIVDRDAVVCFFGSLPHVQMIEADVAWCGDTDAPALQDGEIAALVTTPPEMREDTNTRQCVKAARDYCIHFCRSEDVSTRVRSHQIEARHVAMLHRQTGLRRSPVQGAVVDAQVSHGAGTAGGFSTFLLFEGGYPHGGQCHADVHAPWGTCFTDIPPGGSTILEIPWE